MADVKGEGGGGWGVGSQKTREKMAGEWGRFGLHYGCIRMYVLMSCSSLELECRLPWRLKESIVYLTPIRTAKDIQLLDPAEIPPLRIEIFEELGQGAFGKVSKSKLKDGLDYFVDSKHIVKAKRKEQIVAVKELFGE